MAAPAARRARGSLGLAADGHELLARLCPHTHGLRPWVTEVRSRFPGAQDLWFNRSTTDHGLPNHSRVVLAPARRQGTPCGPPLTGGPWPGPNAAARHAGPTGRPI